MAKKEKAPVEAGAPSTEKLEEVATAELAQVEQVQEEEVISSNIFVAEDGTEVEFAVKHFIFGKRKYTIEEAVAEIPEALQELYDRKSFIFKK